MTADPRAQQLAGEFLTLLADLSPSLLDRAYLTGSAITGDWHEAHSEVDMVFVVARPVTAADEETLGKAHAATQGGNCVDGVHVILPRQPGDVLVRRPRSVAGGARCRRAHRRSGRHRLRRVDGPRPGPSHHHDRDRHRDLQDSVGRAGRPALASAQLSCLAGNAQQVGATRDFRRRGRLRPRVARSPGGRGGPVGRPVHRPRVIAPSSWTVQKGLWATSHGCPSGSVKTPE